MAATTTTSAKRGTAALLAEDVPWRALPAGSRPVPKIHTNPVLRVTSSSSPSSAYGLAVMRKPDPIGDGFATEAQLEAAGPDCLVPGQVTPIRLLGLKVWPIGVSFEFLGPLGRQLQSIGKFMDSAVNLMNASFQDR